MAIERADPHTGRLGDRFETGLNSSFAEQSLGDLDQPIAVPSGISPQRACRIGSFIFPHQTTLDKRRDPPYSDSEASSTS